MRRPASINVRRNEEQAVDWHETQLTLIEQVGLQRYLAEHIHG